MVSEEPLGITIFPAESIVVVALPPKYAFEKTDRRVELAFAKLCNFVHVFESPRSVEDAAVSVPVIVGVKSMPFADTAMV